MLSKKKMGLLFGSMATVLSLGVLGSAYAAEDPTATANTAAQVQEKVAFDKVKMGHGKGFGGGMAIKDNTELLTLLNLDAEALQEELKAGKTLAEIAEAQGVDTQDVIDLLVEQQTEKLAEKVEAGDLTQEQADEMSANLAERVEQQVNNPQPFGHFGIGRGFGHFANSEELLSLLNLDAEALQEQLKAGKTLAEVAEAQGVDTQDVIDLLVKEQTAKLAEAVETGKLTQEQADEMSANLAERVEQQVNNPQPVGHFGMGRGFGGFTSEELLSLLNLDAEALQEQLKAGKTLAEVAEAQGVDKQDVIDLLVVEQTAKLAEAVEAGKLTQEQADERLAQLEEFVANRVEGTFEPKAAPAEKTEEE